MNIFVLDKDPKVCATMHCDKHVVKMILESAQMICTTHHQCHNDNLSYNIPYKQTHVNHPCNRWLRDSLGNYLWLVNLTKHLNNEYKYRYDKNINHKSHDVAKTLITPNLPDIELTPFAQAMPNKYKNQNVTTAYRSYYINEKSNILIGNKRHWRTITKTLCTFMTSKNLLNKYWENFQKTCEDRHDPFEKYINEIYEKELCVSPIKSLSLHLTNVNSSYGLAPFIDCKKLWDENK